MARYRDFDPDDRDERGGRGRGRGRGRDRGRVYYDDAEIDERPVRRGRYEEYEDDHPVVYVDELPAPYGRDPETGLPYSYRSRVIAGLLQIFLGVFGVGRFYLGYNGTGVLMILATIFSAGIVSTIWGLIDGIRILVGDVPDADGLPLKP